MASHSLLGALFDRALARGDPYVALALYPEVGAGRRAALEATILASRRLRLTFAQAPYAPPELLARLVGTDCAVALRLARNPATTPDVLERLALSVDGSTRLIRLLCIHPHASADLLHCMATTTSAAAVRRAIVGNGNASARTLAYMFPVCDMPDLKALSRNVSADHEILLQLWRTGETYVQAEVAGHARCPQMLMEEAERSHRHLVRRKLAQNSATPSTVLQRLLSDLEPQVRAAVVSNPALEIGTLSGVEHDPSALVRRAAARRPGLPAETLARLARDPDTWVRCSVARQPALPGHALRKLAGANEAQVRRAIARHPRCPRSLLRSLACDPNAWVRAGVALRHDVTREILERLGRDEDSNVLAGLARNPDTGRQTLARISRHEDPDVRRALVFNANPGEDLLLALVEDPYTLNRVMLSHHPRLPEEGLWRMIDDPEPQVRFRAAKQLTDLVRKRDLTSQSDSASCEVQCGGVP